MLEPGGDVRRHAGRRQGAHRLALQRGGRGADVRDPLPDARCRGRLRRRRRREPPGLGVAVGRLARATDGDDHRPRRRRPRLGTSGLGARRRHDRRKEREPPGRERVPAPVRRAAHALPAECLHVDGRHAGREGQRARQDRRGGARRREALRARQGADRRRDRASLADGAHRPGARRPARARHLDVRLLALRTRDPHRLRP